MERLLVLRPFCEDWGSSVIDPKKRCYLLSSDEWSEVENIVMVLKWPYQLTVKLQAKDLTLSDVFGHWTIMELKLQKENHPLAQILLKHMKLRREAVLNNPAMIAAVFLDPRYNRLLGMNNRNEALKYLQIFSKRIADYKDQNGSAEQEAANANHETGNDLYGEEVDEDLLTFVQLNDERLASSSSSTATKDTSLELQLETFFRNETFANVQNANGILGYWASSAVRFEYDKLYELARVLMSVPATQVSVERAFSTLRFILNDYRTSLGDDSLENILLLKLNSDM